MSHKTLVDGTNYEIIGGRTLVDGTGYDVTGGRTLVDSTGYDVSFAPPELVIYDGGQTVLVGTLQKHYYENTTGYLVGISNGKIVSSAASSTAGYYTARYCSIGPIDFTDYNSLCVIGYQTNLYRAGFGYKETRPTSYMDYTKGVTFSSNSTEYTLDISDLIGEYYLATIVSPIDNNGVGYNYISKIWLT